ncbi:MAG: VWA domain-containing protein [Spirochaetia bacterium]|nr:VWA domain-containing protein [Spirochaetia bacterium]
MRFGNPDAFNLFFVAVPVLLYMGFRTWHIGRNINIAFDKKTAPRMSGTPVFTLVWVKFGLLVISTALIIVALARPLGKPIKSESTVTGIDIMVACDVSTSMAAIDLRPNRMEVIKQGLKRFVAELEGDRIGIIAFSGIEFVQCPLTTDYDTVSLIVDNLSPGMLSKDGTALGNAIRSSIDRMVEKAEKSKVMILITDGENTAGVSPVEAAGYAKEKGIRIYTVGVGTQQGGRILLGQDVFGRQVYKTYQGQEVVVKLNEGELREIAGITGGKFYRVTDSEAFNKIRSDIAYMEANKTKKEEIKHEENYAPWLLWGILFFVLGQILPTKKPIIN